MIQEYHRPGTLEEALSLLERKAPPTLPLGGGTVLNRQPQAALAVVDLQALGLSGVTREGNLFTLGATTTLQALVEQADLPTALRQAAEMEAGLNLRQVGTLAGTLVTADGRSPLATALLALDARLIWLPGEREVGLGDYLPLRGKADSGRLIVRVTVPANARLAFESVARSPADLPVVCAALAAWPSGRTRVALGGYGAAPLMVMDGTESGGAVDAARAGYSHASDAWASNPYRSETAGTLVRRCLEALA